MAKSLQAKFLRSLLIPVNESGAGQALGAILRSTYEFWGFCMHGSNDLVNPQSMAPSPYIVSMPAGWESGSTVLLATGNDGESVSGFPYFVATGSNPFSPNMVGKYLTTWQSGSLSTDDSIYPITQWLNSGTIVIDVLTGGTSLSTSGSLPQLTSRTNINYRVIDLVAAANMGVSVSSSLVFQFNDASQVNPGQASSQFRFIVGVGVIQDTFGMSIQLSPSGTWNGSQFVGENYPPISTEETAAPGTGGGPHNWTQFGNPIIVNNICGQAFMIVQANTAGGPGSSIQVEVPLRLYPQATDPNLICACNFGTWGVSLIGYTGYNFGHRFFPSPYDALLRRWPVLVRGYTGSTLDGTVFGNFASIGQMNTTEWPNMCFNTYQNKFLMTDGILGMSSGVPSQAAATGQFSLFRSKLRACRFTGAGYPYYMRVGDDNDRWIHVGGGVMWPWDHALLPVNPFPGF